MARAIVTVPPAARRGEIIEIRALLAHPMESGFRSDAEGRTVPRDIVRRFSCTHDGEPIFAAEFFPSIAANPYLSFPTIATASGTLVFTWEGDHGFVHTESVALVVT